MGRKALEKIARDLAPVVFLHPEESYFPCTVEYYVRNCSLWDGKKEMVPEGRMSVRKLPTNPQDTSWTLNVPPEYREGESTDINDVPFYVNIVEKEDVYQIFYIFMYAYNGPFWLCGIPEKCKCCSVGAHQADIEHITVEVKKDMTCHSDEERKISDYVTRVYFAAHGSHDGQWIAAKDLKWKHGKILVYSAKHSHASYQIHGTICRCLGCISDHTGEGYVWNPKNIAIIDDTTRWNQYVGHLGAPDHVPTPKYHSWWGNESETSTNWFCRFFCACY